jgi:trimeric autotransporter adhesin
MKKLLSILLAMCMVLTLLPRKALAVIDYQVWIGGVQVTRDNMTNVLGDGRVSCILSGANDYTLTLNGATITGAYTSGDYKSGIYANGNLKIVLTDGSSNTITGADNSGKKSCGIYANGTLSFDGGGSLNVSGGAATSSYGIYGSSGISFFGISNISAQGGIAVDSSYGISAPYYIMVLGSTVTAKSISTSGTARAINLAPVNLSSDYTITAGTNANGSGAIVIDSTTLSSNFGIYKYLKFLPPPPTAPTATTAAATKVTTTAATLNGTVNANNASSTVTFEYGTDSSYGAAATATQSPVTAMGDNTVSCELTGLTTGTTYHYRVKAVNSVATTYGSDKTFTTLAAAPTVTAANISISGASGTGGAYRIGDTVTATWNNTALGDNNKGITSVRMDFSQFGGGTAVAASNSSDIWTASYTIGPGAIDTINRNVLVTAISAGGTKNTKGTTNAAVDNIAPTVTDNNISLSVGSGAGGVFKLGDVVTVTWNNTAEGDNNSDTISSVTVNFSAFGGGAAVAATNSGGIWTAMYTINESSKSGTNKNVFVTVTDDAGNSKTTADTTNATVDTTADAPISIAAIGGVTAPVRGGIPVSAITETAQYIGTVMWSPNDSSFLGNTVYMATITLTPKTGYTFTGVAANSFTVPGATATNAANSGVITAVFPATAAGALAGMAKISNVAPRIGDVLNGSLVGGNNTGTLSYVWKASGTQVGTGTSYTVAVSDLGKKITIEIKSSVETGTVTSTATAEVLKKVAPSAPGAPTLASKTYNSVTLTANAAYEFSKDGTTWQTGNVFSGLAACTSYTFYQRVAETTDTERSAASMELSVTTDTAPPDALTGTATISNVALRIGDVLNGSLVGGNNTGTLSYVWKASGEQVGTGTRYTVAVSDLGKKITLEIKSSVETGAVISAATAEVLKKVAPSAPGAPTLASKTYSSVTLTANVAYEFSKDGTTWQTENVFSGLTASTEYTFYQRIAATADRESSEASAGLTETTDTAPPDALTGTATISNTAPRIGDVLNGSLIGGNNTGTLSYVWKAGGEQVGTGTSYTVAVSDLGKTITLEIKSSVETDTVTSVATAKVLKKIAPSAPGAPTLASKTYSSVTLTANVAYEFSKDGTTWQTENVFSGLTASTEYTFYQRIAATADTESSEASTGLSVKTDTAPPDALTGTATISNVAPRIGDVLNGSLIGGNNSGTLNYVWKASGEQVGTGTSYTVAVSELGKKIMLEIESSVETGTISSAETAEVLKKVAPSALGAPTLASKTYNSVTLTANAAYEFSKDGTTWQKDNVFSGLTASTAYTFYQRVAETTDTESSAASTGFSVTTNSNYSGGDSGSGGSSSDNSSPVIVTPPTPGNLNSPTKGEIKVPATVDNKGNATVNITDKTVIDAFEKALADAKKNGNEQNVITVVLRVDTGSKTISNVTVNLPKTVQDTIIAKKIVSTIVVVDNPGIRIGMDLTTVKEINRQAKSDVNITATRSDSGKLTDDAKKTIGSRPVFDLKVNYGSSKQVQNFGAGRVSVTIPYTLGANEKAGNVQAVYVDDKGKVHWLVNSVYDSVEKVLRFSTNHFSSYGIGYKQTNTTFTDIAGHWAKEDIEFVVSRGLFSGTSANTFSPNTAMTRGMFVTALGRLANTYMSGYKQSRLNYVERTAYYVGYIVWASKDSIVNGTGNGRFEPDQFITREQMAVMIQNYAKVIGFTLPKVYGENTFEDSSRISVYAKDAVKQMQMAGVISGKNGNHFDPQGTVTRAEASAVLRRFVELAIFSDTM